MSNKKIPCEYTGGHKVDLHKYGGPYFDGKGQQLLDLTLNPGDSLMMPEEEVLGFTLLRDMSGVQEPINLGVGRVVLSEHQGKDDEELYAIGYQFHQGRPDFRPLPTLVSEKKKKESDK